MYHQHPSSSSSSPSGSPQKKRKDVPKKAISYPNLGSPLPLSNSNILNQENLLELNKGEFPSFLSPAINTKESKTIFPFEVSKTGNEVLNEKAKKLYDLLVNDIFTSFVQHKQDIKTIYSLINISVDQNKSNQPDKEIKGNKNNDKQLLHLTRRNAEIAAFHLVKMLTSEEIQKALKNKDPRKTPHIYVFDLIRSKDHVIYGESYDRFIDAFDSMKELGLGWLFLLSIGSALINAASPPIHTEGSYLILETGFLLLISFLFNVYVNALYNPKQIYENLIIFKQFYRQVSGSPVNKMGKRFLAIFCLFYCTWVGVNRAISSAASGIHNHANSVAVAIVLFIALALPAAFQGLGGLLGQMVRAWSSLRDYEEKQGAVPISYLEGIKFLMKDALGLMDSRTRGSHIVRALYTIVHALSMSFVMLTYASNTHTGIKMLGDLQHILDQDVTHPLAPSTWSAGNYINDLICGGFGSFLYLRQLSLSLFDNIWAVGNDYYRLKQINYEIEILKKKNKQLLEGKELSNVSSRGLINASENTEQTEIKIRISGEATTPLLEYQAQKSTCRSMGQLMLVILFCLFIILLGACTGVGLSLSGFGSGESWQQAFSNSSSLAFPILVMLTTGYFVASFNTSSVFRRKHAVLQHEIGIAIDKLDSEVNLYKQLTGGELNDYPSSSRRSSISQSFMAPSSVNGIVDLQAPAEKIEQESCLDRVLKIFT